LKDGFVCFECVRSLKSFYFFKKKILKSHEDDSENFLINVETSQGDVKILTLPKSITINKIKKAQSITMQNLDEIQPQVTVKAPEFSATLVDPLQVSLGCEVKKEEYEIAPVIQFIQPVEEVTIKVDEVTDKTISKTPLQLALNRALAASSASSNLLKVAASPINSLKFTASSAPLSTSLKVTEAKKNANSKLLSVLCSKWKKQKTVLRRKEMIKEARSVELATSLDPSSNSLICDICNFHTENRDLFTNHFIVLHDKVLGSDQAVLPPPIEPKRRLEVQIVCTICGKMIFKHSIKSHLEKVHGDGKIHQCDTCGKKYNYKHELRKHIMIKHTDEKHFQCDTCGYRCATRHYFHGHMKIHLHPKDYKFRCKLCLKAFVDNTRFKKHMKATHSTDEIDDGIKVNLETNKFHCPFCNIAMHRKLILHQHIQKFHKDQK
jgi:hypothetical protein